MKGRAIALGGLALVLVLYLLVPADPDKIGREPLDGVWEDLMLSGLHASDIPASARVTGSRIEVRDLRESRFLLWRNGGWILQGRPVTKIEGGVATIALYRKVVVRQDPFFILNLAHFQTPPAEKRGDEFFLLHRKRGAARATLLKKWVFGPADLEVPGEDVRGFLSYRPEGPVTGSIVVLIEGLRSPFQEAVDLPRGLLL